MIPHHHPNNTPTPLPTLTNPNKPLDASDERLNNEFQVYAPDVVKMRMCRDASDLEDESREFAPEYLNQIYGPDESIIGYKDIAIQIFFKADDLQMYMAQSYDADYRMRQCQDDYDPLDRFLKKPVEWDDDHKAAVYWPVDRDLNAFRERFEKEDAQYTPPGQELAGYKTRDGREFVIFFVPSIAHDEKATELTKHMQFLALLYIDACSYIDHEDPKWQLFMTYEKYRSKGGQTRYAFVGFTTVHQFYGHPHKTRLRVSQVLVIPPYQRQGHGGRMLSAIYSFARKQLGDQCLEVTVEDPSVEYQAVRDRIDFLDFCAFMEQQQSSPPQWLQWNGILLVWSDAFWRHVREVLKLSRDQIRRCFELYNFASIMSNETLSVEQREVFLREFRLDVKRRIYQIYDMRRIVKDPMQRKEKLNEIWETISQEFLQFLKDVQRIQGK